MSIPEFVSDKSLTLHRVFESQVEKTPEAIALVFDQEQLTYRELNERANQLAHYLRSLNVAPEMLVGICLERSIEMIVGMLGILKAGAAFVPLAPSQPQERKAFILADTKVEVLLTLKKLVAGIPVPPSHLVCLDAEEENISANSKSDPVSGVQPENLAYTIYTSGSTGQPKGVMVSHQAICQGFLWMQEIFPITQQDRILQKLPLTFDFSFWELFWPLMTGACVVLAKPGGEKDSAYLVKLIARQKISILVFVPSVLQVFLSEADLKTCKNIRMVFTGGEPLTSALKDRFFNQLPNCRLYDLFGATENIIVTYWSCQPEEKVSSFTLGRPFPNLSIYVVDEQLQPVPVGETGELLVGGWGLARGYLNRKELTAQKFISNAFKENSKERLYRTGDKVRYLSDGTIEILGRIDNQVKIRGFRIELGEIEEKLSQHLAVKQVAVIAREDVPGDKRLVAYVVLHSSQKSEPKSISSLRHFLKQQLPDYMIPSSFVVLEALPLNPNGKVDRRALPVPEIRPADLPTFVAPRTPIEKMLAGIWANILRVELVGIHDNFFELGGHSLLAAQIIARMRVSLGVELPFSRLLEFPTVAGLAHIVEEARKHQVRPIALPLQPISRSQTIPISFSQEQLWFLHQLTPEESVYNEPCTIRLKGAINVDALEKALNEIIKRHESLRTRFLTVDGQPVQVIDPPHTFNLAVVDLREFPQEQREAEALRLATIDAKQQFDLKTGPLLRATLMQLADFDYRLFLTFHHIIIDGVSLISVFLKELAALYEAYSIGKPSPLAELPIQYADFAVWQRQWLKQEILESQLDYWKQKLADLPILQLPLDHPRPAVGTFRGARQCLVLSKDLTEALKTLSQQEGVTLYMTLLAAFKTLLYRYTGQDDIVVGTFSANRNRPELEGLIGYFLNTLVLRTDMSGTPSFRELLGRVRQVTLGAYAHEDLPFEKLVQTLQPERNLSQNPLFQVAFAPQPPMPSLNSDWTVSQLDIQTDTAKFDLTLELDSRPEGIVGRFEYNTDLFEAATISRMIGHFKTLLAGIVANPQARVSELPLLSEAERYQLLVEWNNTTKEYPSDKCIHQLFEEQVERTPDAVAVVFEGQQLTYQQLNARANQLAHYLQTLGVGPEVLVGICVERSLEMVVGLLGILKAGGAYVPLDPVYPCERLAFILEDTSMQVLLTQTQLVESLPSHLAQVVCLDTDWETINQHNQENLTSGVIANNLAYVMYTSGSTGLPKGVSVIHRGVVRLVKGANYADLSAEQVFLQVAPISFDASTFEIWGCLLNGARLVIFPSSTPSLEQLGQAIGRYQITTLWLTAGLFHLMVDERLEDLKPLRQLLAGGDVLSVPHVQKFFLKRGECKLINGYGPTENTTFTCCYPLTEPTQFGNSVPIGRPIANTQVYLLSAQLQPVPIGVPGELYIGGDGLARGYFNRPDLTDEKFIPNPFSNILGSRLYKTGDKARYLPDGNIEFLGRIDNQVKIRGFRIEPGEIEAVISQHPGVQETVVVALQDLPNRKYLAAYIVEDGQSTTSSNLRGFLKQRLPDYMIPSTFVMLSALPLTPNGKVDRRALPKPDTAHQELAAAFVPPRTRLEELLTQIWREVLHLEQVGIHDNFFEVGGDSILSILIISKANIAGVQITPKQIFQHQTIAELALVASTTETLKAFQGLVTGTLPLTPIQYWFFEQNLPSPHHWNQAFLLEVQQELDPTKLQQAVQQLLVHHDALRLRFTQSDSGWQQVSALTDEIISFSFINLSTLLPNQQTSAIEAKATEFQASLNLESGPLLQVALFHLGETIPDRLLLVIHHLAVDGVSWRILLEDLQTAYQQLQNGQPIQLPAKTTSFKHWAEKLTEYARTDAAKKELTYWQNISSTQITHLPIDCTEGANTEASARTVSVSLNIEETRALLTEVPKAYRTQINDVLLTALALVLANWSQSTSVLINLEGHGREEILPDVDLSRTVGWFTTIFPVLLKLVAPENLGETIKSIKEQLRAIPNRGIGYGLLRYLSEDASITSQLSSLPQAEVSFNYLGQFDWGRQENSLFKLATESIGSEHNKEGHRRHLLDINGIVVEGQLKLDWTYSNSFHQRATIEGLAHNYIQALRTIIAHCLSPEAFGYTPTDFPLAKLEPKELDSLLTQLSEISNSSLKEEIEDIYPLSSMQQGMLFHSLHTPDEGVYFIQSSWGMQGNLNVEAFELAWQQVVERHPILRTAFVWTGHDKPLQVVYRNLLVPLEILDWRELSSVEQEQQLEAFLLSDRQQSFQLSLAPLMRLVLIQLGEDVYQFVWSFHHLLLDGWSLPSVVKEVFAVYDALSSGQNVKLEPVRPYRDYIAWLLKQDLAKAEVFWRQTLKGFIAPTSIKVDRALTSQENQQESYKSQEIQLTVQLTDAIKSFAQQNKLTMSTLVQGAWTILLSQYSGEADVVFGVTVSGRNVAIKGVESIVGLLINTLPMRAIVSPNDSPISWLKKVQNQLQEMNQYEYSPLVQIQGWSEVPRGLPLFESIVVFENYPEVTAVWERNFNLHLSDVRSFVRTNYPLTVTAVPGTQLSLRLAYDGHRFDDSTITRMTGHFQTILETIVANPDGRISQISLLTEAERHQLLVSWNATRSEYPQDKCIHQLFEEQVQRTPDAIAVVFEDKQLTYLQLNQRANQLAHHLQRLGVEPEVLVGICVERSIEMVVSLLGILKAGGAYLPLDPALPQESLTFRLIDAQIPILLTQKGLLKREEAQVQTVLYLDADWELIAQQSEANPKSEVIPENLAYVLYTSGSTGEPKGVAIEQRQILNYLHAILDKLQLPTGASFATVSTFAADLGNTAIFPALCTGGCLHIISQERATDPKALAEYFVRHPIDCLKITPTHLATLLTSKAFSSIVPRKCLVLGGEAASWIEIEKIQQEAPNCRILNHYGPTETTVGVLTYPIESKQASYNSKTVPIGRPIANTQVYILDCHLQPVPIGVPGELHIGGASLARGYLNRPDLTGEKFINLLIDNTNTRLYKTGDLVRYLSDGNIEFLGRLDRQVKIRGFRIELSEIETTLASHPAVGETVVVAREDIPGHKYLAAYIVCNQKEALTSSALRDFLKEKLPNYMVPGAFVMLNALPLTPNGKVDHQTLPTPDTANQELETTFVAARTRQEELLARIWCEVLHLQQVSIHDNFFELGGDSILSIQIIAKTNQAGLQLTPKQIFQHQTIAELATVVSTTGTTKAEQGLVTGTLPLTPIQQRFFAQNLPEAHHYNQAFLLEVPPTFDSTLLQQVLQQLLIHHDALRLRFTKSEEGWQQFNALPDEAVPFSRVDLSTLPETEQASAIEATSAQLQASLNFHSEPLVRVALFHLGDYQPSRLLLVIHHLAVDGVSWRILLEDLQTAYQQLESGCSIQLPAKTTSFKHWAEKLTEYARSSVAKKELTYWQSLSRTQITRLPVDCSEGANTEASARTVSVSLNVEETRALLQEVPKAYRTQINDVLLTALVQVLAAWSGSNFVLIELEGHGREEILSDVDLSRTVGWFTTRFSVLLEHKATDNLGDIIKSIKEQLGAVPNRGIGYGLLRYLSGDASITSILQALPTAEVSFNYLGQFDWGMQAGSLFKLAPESVGPERSNLGHRSHLLDINGIVVEGQLQLEWTYSENFHHRTTIESLAQDYASALRSLIAHCLSPSARSYTPDVSENPTIQSLAQYIDSRQHEEDNATIPLHLLELPEGISELLPDDIDAAYPLAKMQEFMLHHYKNDPQKMGVYHSQKSYDIYDESIDLNAFKKALEILVQKHPALRTVFITSNGTSVVQVVKKSLTFSISEQDITHIKSDKQENYIDVVMKQDRQNLFDIENPHEPLFRFRVFRKAKNRFEFLMSVHHAITDGWGSSEFLNQLYELYGAFKKGEEITVVPDANVYKEFIALEKEIIGSQDAADFWRLQLKNHVYKPLKPCHASVNEGEAVACEHILNSEIIQDLQKLCRKLKVSPKAVFLSTYLDLIGTLMKEKTVCVGTVSNGRTERLSDPLGALGLFWNMVPFCQSISSDKGVQIKNVQQSLVEVEPYVRYPLLQILADQQKTELFFATFNFVNFHNAKNISAHTGLKVQGRRFHDKFNFPLNYAVSMEPSSGNVSIHVEYDQMYFSCKDIRSMLQNYLEMVRTCLQTC